MTACRENVVLVRTDCVPATAFSVNLHRLEATWILVPLSHNLPHLPTDFHRNADILGSLYLVLVQVQAQEYVATEEELAIVTAVVVRFRIINFHKMFAPQITSALKTIRKALVNLLLLDLLHILTLLALFLLTLESCNLCRTSASLLVSIVLVLLADELYTQVVLLFCCALSEVVVVDIDVVIPRAFLLLCVRLDSFQYGERAAVVCNFLALCIEVFYPLLLVG